MRIALRTIRSTRAVPRVAVALAAIGTLVSTAAAHDFWIIPDVFAFSPSASVRVSARQGGDRFPAGTAIQAERVVDARIIGASTTEKITDLSIAGTSLRLQQKPTTVGQYLIVVGLAPRVMRQTPSGVFRFLKAEGGAAEAERLERENSFAGLDSVIFTAASYAATIVEFGNGGPRAYAKTAGLRLEFVPMNDPSHVHVGDTLHVRMLGNGRPLPGIGIELAVGLDSAAGEAASVSRVPYTADAKGVVHLPLNSAGPILLRSAYASRKVQGETREWDVSRSTFVFNVGSKH